MKANVEICLYDPGNLYKMFSCNKKTRACTNMFDIQTFILVKYSHVILAFVHMYI